MYKRRLLLLAVVVLPLLMGVNCKKDSEKNYVKVELDMNEKCIGEGPIVYTFKNAKATLVTYDQSTNKLLMYIDNVNKPKQQELPLLSACNMPKEYEYGKEGMQIIFSGYIHKLNERADYFVHPITLTEFKVKKQ